MLRLKRNSEQACLVRLWCDEPFLDTVRRDEIDEHRVAFDVIGDQQSAVPQEWPSLVELVPHRLRRMKTVMDEYVDRSDGSACLPYPPPARTSYVLPVRPGGLIHQHLRMGMPAGTHWREVYAPEATDFAVGLGHGAQDQRTRDAARYPGLENTLRRHVTYGAPDDVRQI